MNHTKKTLKHQILFRQKSRISSFFCAHAGIHRMTIRDDIHTFCYFSEPVYDYVIGQASQSVSAGQAYRNLRMHKKIFFDSIRYVKSLDILSEEKQQIIRMHLSDFLNNHYNIYLRNALKKGAWKGFCRRRCQIQKRALAVDREAMQRYRHLRIAFSGRIGFYFVALMFWIYKRVCK